jgi:hypothetical protein
MCLGTWMGFVISLIFILAGIALPLIVSSIPVSVFLHGLLSGGGVWFINSLEEMFERIGKKEK